MVAFCHPRVVVMGWGGESTCRRGGGRQDALGPATVVPHRHRSGLCSTRRKVVTGILTCTYQADGTLIGSRVDKIQPIVLTVFQRHGSHHPDGDGAPEVRRIFSQLSPQRDEDNHPEWTEHEARAGSESTPRRDGKLDQRRYFPRRSACSSEVGAHVASSESREGALPRRRAETTRATSTHLVIGVGNDALERKK